MYYYGTVDMCNFVHRTGHKHTTITIRILINVNVVCLCVCFILNFTFFSCFTIFWRTHMQSMLIFSHIYVFVVIIITQSEKNKPDETKKKLNRQYVLVWRSIIELKIKGPVKSLLLGSRWVNLLLSLLNTQAAEFRRIKKLLK